MRNSLSPSFVQATYTTKYGIHVATFPTLLHSSAAIGLPGEFTTHNSDVIGGDTMVEGLLNTMADRMPNTSSFIRYAIMRQVDPLDLPLNVYEKGVTIPGTVVPDPDIFDKAVSFCLSIRTTAFALLRIFMLDLPAGNVFGNVYTIAASEQDIVDALTDADAGWTARGGGRPTVFTNASISLNKRLRRSYKMI